MIALRNQGLAELENEKYAEAARTFRRLTIEAENDPLGFANLAIALLRQADAEAARFYITLGLLRAKDRPDLLAIEADILAWLGESEQALALLRRAAEGDPENPETLYALVRHGESLGTDAAEEAVAWADALLVRLRPENLVVLLRRGQRAIQEGDRAIASEVYLRVRELLWQAQPAAAPELAKVLEALESGDVPAARIPALRLSNVLKSTAAYKSSLVELNTGIQGVPVDRFVNEPEAQDFGAGVEVTFHARTLDTRSVSGRAVVSADFDGDEKPDLAWIGGDGIGDEEASWLNLKLASSEEIARLPSAAVRNLLTLDLDNDAVLDLVGFGGHASGQPLELRVWRGLAQGRFQEATEQFNLDGVSAVGFDALDFDSEGDLDVAVATTDGLELYRNNLVTPFERPEQLEAVGALALPLLALRSATSVFVSDLDGDGDTDIIASHAGGVTWLDNLRQGRFSDRTQDAGLSGLGALVAVVSADLSNDGLPELIVAGDDLRVLENHGGSFEPASSSPEVAGSIFDLLTFDADNDGRLDIAVAGSSGVSIFVQRDDGFELRPVTGLSGPATGLAAIDFDGDGDVDLVAASPQGLLLLDNEGGNANCSLEMRLVGLRQGNDKNNAFGRGATIEVRVGSAYQYREVRDPVTHLGLGQQRHVDSVRVVWNNGVPQHRLQPELNCRSPGRPSNQSGTHTLVEEQVLKGSCPFLYIWNGRQITFVTDLLWGAPLGMPVAAGAWASSDPEELVLIGAAEPRDGYYDLRVTEELWEAAYFDLVRLWVVDHPVETEAASSLRVFPGAPPPGGLDDKVRLTALVRAVHRAWDGEQRDVTDRVRSRDGVYADGYPVGDYQGIASRPWTFTFDLGQAPERPIRLLLDGWIFPADASLNLAAAQRDDLDFTFTRLEAETEDGWISLLDPMGFPAGKTKTTVVDVPTLPRGVRKLRIVTSRWLHWDRIAWSESPRDEAAQVRARLEPTFAELEYRGFSRLRREAPNAPHTFDYAEVATESPWLPFPGNYTRYGDVRELLEQDDDRLVMLAPGDQMKLLFDASALPIVEPGMKRSLFLESHGWDKDADRNTYRAESAEPLPFRAMSGYPYAEQYPDTKILQAYKRDWQTRQVDPPRKAGDTDGGR